MINDHSECYIKTVLMTEQKQDYIAGLIELNPVRIKNLDISQLLICTNDTTKIDIKSFIETALADKEQ